MCLRCRSHAEPLRSSLTGTGERKGARAGSQVRRGGGLVAFLTFFAWRRKLVSSDARDTIVTDRVSLVIGEPARSFPRLLRNCEPPFGKEWREWADQEWECALAVSYATPLLLTP